MNGADDPAGDETEQNLHNSASKTGVGKRGSDEKGIFDNRGSSGSNLLGGDVGGIADPYLTPVSDEDISKSLVGLHIGPRPVAYKRNVDSTAGKDVFSSVQLDSEPIILTQKSNLHTRGQPKVKSRKKRELLDLPSSVQIGPKQLLPTPKTGSWWECPANDEGWQIKLRWRDGEPPYTYVFARVGKNEFQTWKELSQDDRTRTIADRLESELHAKGRFDVAKRIGLAVGDD